MMKLRWSLRRQIEGEGTPGASVRVGVLTQLGHGAVALLEVSFAREIIARATTAEKIAIRELRTNVEVHRAMGREDSGIGEVWSRNDAIRCLSAQVVSTSFSGWAGDSGAESLIE